MSKRDGQQGAGIESGTTVKEKIDRDYLPNGQINEKSQKPKPAPNEKANFTWNDPPIRRLMADQLKAPARPQRRRGNRAG